MKPSALFLLAVLAAGLLLSAAGLRAQRFPRELENIKLFGKGEAIEFIFSQPYEGNPVSEFKTGSFALTFSGTGSAKPVRSLLPVEESLFKEIKVVQNRYSTTVTFQLKDPKLNLKDKLAFASDKNLLKVTLDSPAPQGVASPQGRATQQLLREMETRIAGSSASGTPEAAGMPGAPGTLGTLDAAGTAQAAPADAAVAGSALALGDLGGTQFFYSLLTMVIALVIIVGALYGMLYLYNRYVAVRLRRFTGGQGIRQVAAFHIGPRQRIVVLEINGEMIACGVTPSQITYLTHLGGASAGGGRRLPGEGEGIADGQALGGGLKAAGLAAEPPPKRNDPVHQFAEVLKQKVRSLKRIN